MDFIPCLRCNAAVEYNPADFPPGWQPHAYCEKCSREMSMLQAKARGAAYKEDKFNLLCPPLFRDTVLERLPYPELSTKALQIDLGRGTGINLWGFPDTGKTRTLYLILRQSINDGRSALAFSPADFCNELSERSFKRAPWVRRLCAVNVLAFDDVDKLNLTREQELCFFGILDKRMANERPCLFTHNSSAAELEYQFRNGKAMVRRIRQFTQSFHFPARL